jgi:hypothetical protein
MPPLQALSPALPVLLECLCLATANQRAPQIAHSSSVPLGSPIQLYNSFMKIALAALHTFLAFGVGYIFSIEFVWSFIPNGPDMGTYISGALIIVLLVSVVSGWVVACRQATSLWWKILAYSSVPVYLLFVYYFVLPQFEPGPYSCNEVFTEEGKKLLCTNGEGEQFYRELSE